YDQPQRALAVCYVHNMTRYPDYTGVGFNIIPGVGEYFVIPGLTLSGPCDQMFFEGIPGGPLDCFQEVKSSEEHLALAKQQLDKWLPWEAERCRNVELTDANASLRGRYAPTVRKPVGTLPSGAKVLGMADTVVLNDPITGQGANSAVKCADVYRQRILERGAGLFDEAWMQETFDAFWDYAQWVTHFTNAMLQPPPPHVLNILGAAVGAPRIASRFTNAFDNPRDFFPWLADPVEADRFIAANSQ
ncbi:MAG TPA: styrene monooxygenase/indole monooxygenase family protein, partial [Chthonomonadaceae bacterium]|nr:styrene monooxygenase/indole monooxygenase family protein [Chthonomonadaceae bacterium]